jgi:hypothetical protein
VSDLYMPLHPGAGVLGMFGSGHAREQDPRQCIHRGPIEPKAVVDLHTVCSMTRLIGEAS